MHSSMTGVSLSSSSSGGHNTTERTNHRKGRAGRVAAYAILFLVLFAVSAFRSQEHLYLLIGIAGLVFVSAIVRVLGKPSIAGRVLANGFVLWITLLFAMFAVYGLVLERYASFNADYVFFMYAMTLSVIVLLVDKERQAIVRLFSGACMLTCVGLCLFIWISEWSLIVSGGTRIGESASGNVNTVAVYLGTMSIAFVYRIVFRRQYRYVVPYLLVAVTMLLTGSKKAILCILLSVGLFVFRRYRRRLFGYILAALVTGLVSAAVWLLVVRNEYLYDIIGDRLLDSIRTLGLRVEGASESYSTAMRLEMYRRAFEAFLSKPFFGGGWSYFSEYSGLGTYSHSNYMELLTTYGLFGFTLYYAMYLFVLARLVRILDGDENANLH